MKIASLVAGTVAVSLWMGGAAFAQASAAGPSADGGAFYPSHAEKIIGDKGYRVRYTPVQHPDGQYRSEVIDKAGIDHIVDVKKDGTLDVVTNKERVFGVEEARRNAAKAGWIVDSTPYLAGNAYKAMARDSMGVEKPIMIYQDGRVIAADVVIDTPAKVHEHLVKQGYKVKKEAVVVPARHRVLAEDNYGNDVVIDVQADGRITKTK